MVKMQIRGFHLTVTIYSLSRDAVIVSTPLSLLISVGLISAKIVFRALPFKIKNIAGPQGR